MLYCSGLPLLLLFVYIIIVYINILRIRSFNKQWRNENFCCQKLWCIIHSEINLTTYQNIIRLYEHFLSRAMLNVTLDSYCIYSLAIRVDRLCLVIVCRIYDGVSTKKKLLFSIFVI